MRGERVFLGSTIFAEELRSFLITIETQWEIVSSDLGTKKKAREHRNEENVFFLYICIYITKTFIGRIVSE